MWPQPGEEVERVIGIEPTRYDPQNDGQGSAGGSSSIGSRH